MLDVRGAITLMPMMRAAVALAMGIAVGDAVGERLAPEAWLLASLAMALLAWWAKEKMFLGSILVWLTIAYLGAFSMSLRIASDGPRQPFSKSQPTELQTTVNEVRRPLLEDMHKRLSEAGMTSDAIGLMTAMTVAERSGINRDTRESFSIAGVSHVLALSGLHVGIIALVMAMLLGGRHKRVTEILLIAVIWGYVLIAGLPISAVRAALMLTVWNIMSLARRRQHPMNVLGTAIVFMFLLNPATLFDVGFQLSCVAVFFLLLCMPHLMGLCPWNRRSGRWLWGLLATSFVAQMATAPLVAFYFGRFSVYSFLTNIVVVPLAPVVIVVGMLAALSLLLPFAFFTIGAVWVENSVVAMLLAVVRTVAELPGASVEHISVNAFQVMLIYVLILCFMAIGHKLCFKMDFAQNL